MASRFLEAVRELAHSATSAQFREPITLAQAAKHVDSELEAEWIGRATAVQSPHQVISDFLIEKMSYDEAMDFLTVASLSFDTPTQREVIGQRVVNMLVKYVAEDIRKDAELAADKLEREGPVDDEIFNAYFDEGHPGLRTVFL
jgi:hypothetical protein